MCSLLSPINFSLFHRGKVKNFLPKLQFDQRGLVTLYVLTIFLFGYISFTHCQTILTIFLDQNLIASKAPIVGFLPICDCFWSEMFLCFLYYVSFVLILYVHNFKFVAQLLVNIGTIVQ